MTTVDWIVQADYVLPMTADLPVIRNGAIAISGNRIVFAGAAEEAARQYTSGNILKGSGKVAFPGLINTHTHAAMVFFRGLSDDLPLKIWLEEHIWPAEGRWLSPEFVGDAVGLASVEMLRAGVTVYNDMYFFGDAAAEATRKAGMRAVLGVGILDFPSASARTTDEYLANAERFISTWKGDSLITPCIAPHALYTCAPETLRRSKAISGKWGVPVHIHLSETEWEVGEILSRYGRRPVEHLESLGFLDETVLAAHCVWLDDREIDLLARREVGVAHCIESNLKLASGFAPVVPMINKGVKVTFGTDGAASNNDLSIMSEMATAAKVHKALAKDPTVLDAKTVLLMATRWGAEVLGMGDRIGSLEQGKAADIVLADISKPHHTPLYDIYSHIVYSMMASDIETVFVDGKIVLQDGEPTLVDETEIIRKAAEWGEKIRAADTRKT